LAAFGETRKRPFALTFQARGQPPRDELSDFEAARRIQRQIERSRENILQNARVSEEGVFADTWLVSFRATV
jgi:hypothetical protein